MSVETHRVLIGACGWKHSDWLQNFYDEDLPEDWQLGFYSNEFSVVYVPTIDWIDNLEMDEWSDNVSESFRFIFEVSASLLRDEDAFLSAITKVKALNELCLGFVFQLDQTICDDVSLFQSRYEAANMVAAVCVNVQNIIISNEFEQGLLKKNISQLWNGKDTESLGFRGGLSISRVKCNGLAMRDLRDVLETCLAASNEGCISVLILEGEPPSLEMLRNADTLLNLL